MEQKSKDDIINELQEKVEVLQIKLKHLENDFFLTAQESEVTNTKYLEILAHLEELVAKRTHELDRSKTVLEHKGQELQIMLDASPVIIFYKDKNLRYIRVNKAFADFVGRPYDDILGKTDNDIYNDIPSIFKERDYRVVNGRETILKQNETLGTVGGKRHVVIDRLPFYDVDGKINGLIGFIVDETRMRLYEEANIKLTMEAVTDPLTHALNRRGMYEKLNFERVRCERSGKQYAVIICDIDHFKEFNDTHGHECGDMVLTNTASALRHTLRRQDSVARWGGEEFLLLLPETSPEGVAIVARKLRSVVRAQKIRYRQIDLSVKLTYGVACGDATTDVDYVIKCADEALYWGKNHGRDQVVIYTAPESKHE